MEINNNHVESPDLISFILKNKRPLIILTIISLIISAVFAFFVITPKFESTVIIFPASSSSVSHELLTDNLYEKNILKFGEEEEVEQLIQMLSSDKIRNRIIEKYDLMKHYRIDPNSQYPITKLKNTYIENVKFTKTKYLSIEIDVLDEDAQMAADIANDISMYLDTVINEMQRERAIRALNIVEKEYFSLKAQIEKLQDSLLTIRRLGVFDFESQSEVYNDAYATALANGRLDGAKKIEEKLQALAEYGGASVYLRDLIDYELKKLSILESKYQEAKVDAELDLPRKFIVSNAVKSEKKAYPIRWIIILVSTLLTFLFSLLLLILLDLLKKKI